MNKKLIILRCLYRIWKEIIPIAIIFVLGIQSIFGLINLVNGQTYYGNFENAELLESNGIVRKWEVTNKTDIFDEQPYTFWDDTNMVLSTETVNVIHGVSSLKILSLTGTYIYHNQNPHYNFTYDYFYLWIYSNKSDLIDFKFHYSDGYFYIRDYSISDIWNNIIIEKDDFSNTGGTPDWFNIRAVQITYIANDEKLYLDYFFNWINIYYYEIWEGSTLLYQSAIEPDINDFIVTQETSYAINNIYVFVILVITWFITFLAVKSPLFGIISLFLSASIFVFISPSVTDSLLIGLILATLVIDVIVGLISSVIILSRW